MIDDDKDLLDFDEEGDEEKEEEKKGFRIPKWLYFVSFFVLVTILTFIIANITYSVLYGEEDTFYTEGQEDFYKVPEIDPPLKTFPLTTFDKPLVVNLDDPLKKIMYIISLQLELGISPEDREIEKELFDRRIEVRDMLQRVISKHQFSDINNTDKRLALKKLIINKINNMLEHNRIVDLYYKEFVWTKR